VLESHQLPTHSPPIDLVFINTKGYQKGEQTLFIVKYSPFRVSMMQNTPQKAGA
jgi:hypothetical protein